MERPDFRLRTAFLLSVGDVFFGAIGVLVILIILSANRSEPRMLEPFDVRATCFGTDEDSFQLMPETGGQALSAEAWLDRLPEDRFITRWGIRPRGSDLACYLIARKIAANYNRNLEQRGATQAVLAVEYWPKLDEGPSE